MGETHVQSPLLEAGAQLVSQPPAPADALPMMSPIWEASARNASYFSRPDREASGNRKKTAFMLQSNVLIEKYTMSKREETTAAA
jgi:hypothetical protein